MTLEIQYTGRNIEITPALREFADSKFQRALDSLSKITNVQVIFEVNKLRQIAEANLHYHGTEINAQAESENMYKSIDDLIDKITRQIIKHKEKHDEHR
jgi:putative sigma-54 modulation protein